MSLLRVNYTYEWRRQEWHDSPQLDISFSFFILLFTKYIYLQIDYHNDDGRKHYQQQDRQHQ